MGQLTHAGLLMGGMLACMLTGCGTHHMLLRVGMMKHLRSDPSKGASLGICWALNTCLEHAVAPGPRHHDRLAQSHSTGLSKHPESHADGAAWRAGARGLGSVVRHPEGCSRHLSRLGSCRRRPLGTFASDAGRGMCQVREKRLDLPFQGVGPRVVSKRAQLSCLGTTSSCR